MHDYKVANATWLQLVWLFGGTTAHLISARAQNSLFNTNEKVHALRNRSAIMVDERKLFNVLILGTNRSSGKQIPLNRSPLRGQSDQKFGSPAKNIITVETHEVTGFFNGRE